MTKTRNDVGDRAPIALSELHLDADNPRFGGVTGNREQSDILDHVVSTFGVDDVLSSLAVNGYFDAEPLVCRREKDGRFVVVEGNRRLSACLILTGDVRASRQAAKTKQYAAIWEAHGKRNLDPIPCIVFDENQQQELLSYLGVRHIASAQPWDSYAKAAWVANIVDKSSLTVADVALMIGDQHKTIARLLEGYYVMRQLTEAGAFDPQSSQRRGRGSVSEYPFSWVYTILGYTAVRRFLDLPEGERKWPPLQEEALPKASLVVRSMFGDRVKGRSGAIEDSREIGALASAFGSQEKVSLLEAGKSLKEIERQTQPIEERLRRGLADVRELQADLSAALAEEQVPQEVAIGVGRLANINRKAAVAIERRLTAIAIGGSDEEADDL